MKQFPPTSFCFLPWCSLAVVVVVVVVLYPRPQIFVSDVDVHILKVVDPLTFVRDVDV